MSTNISQVYDNIKLNNVNNNIVYMHRYSQCERNTLTVETIRVAIYCHSGTSKHRTLSKLGTIVPYREVVQLHGVHAYKKKICGNLTLCVNVKALIYSTYYRAIVLILPNPGL